MSIQRELRMVCNRCGEESPVGHLTATRKEVKEFEEERGWKRINQVDADICPSCVRWLKKGLDLNKSKRAKQCQCDVCVFIRENRNKIKWLKGEEHESEDL